jgi:hypothetical protein
LARHKKKKKKPLILVSIYSFWREDFNVDGLSLKKKEIQQVYFSLIWFWVYWLIKVCYEIMEIFMMFLDVFKQNKLRFLFWGKKIKSRFYGNGKWIKIITGEHVLPLLFYYY